MAILKIAKMGAPVLGEVAEQVVDPTGEEIAGIASNMLETLIDAGGLGLAAPQVYISKRIILLFRLSSREEELNYDDATNLLIMINPVIEPVSNEMDVDWEACLSVPGMMGAVPRYRKIRYTWSDLEGEKYEDQAEGFFARAIQHENDHLDGILYPQRIKDLQLFGFSDEVNRNLNLLKKGSLEK